MRLRLVYQVMCLSRIISIYFVKKLSHISRTPTLNEQLDVVIGLEPFKTILSRVRLKQLFCSKFPKKYFFSFPLETPIAFDRNYFIASNLYVPKYGFPILEFFFLQTKQMFNIFTALILPLNGNKVFSFI